MSQKLKPLLEHPTFLSAGSICELGCGPGTNYPSLSSKRYLGVDIDPKYVAHARAQFGDKFIVGDLSAPVNLSTDKFDVVLLHSVLHHLNDDAVEVALRSAKSLLAAGGTLHVFDLKLPHLLSLPGVLARADYGDFIRPWNRWSHFFDSDIPGYSRRDFSLNLFGFEAYLMFHLTWRAVP